jgi:hypothetical protein
MDLAGPPKPGNRGRHRATSNEQELARIVCFGSCSLTVAGRVPNIARGCRQRKARASQRGKRDTRDMPMRAMAN